MLTRFDEKFNPLLLAGDRSAVVGSRTPRAADRGIDLRDEGADLFRCASELAPREVKTRTAEGGRREDGHANQLPSPRRGGKQRGECDSAGSPDTASNKHEHCAAILEDALRGLCIAR